MTSFSMLPVIIGSALLDSINPCAFSILFLTIAFLFSLNKSRKFVLAVGAVYILGIAFVYVGIGLGFLQVMSFFNVPNGLAKLGALILIVFSLIGLINEFFPKFPIKLKIPSLAHPTIARYVERGSIPSAFVLGLLVGMFEFPCTGGPYLFVLGLLHDHATFALGFAYLVIYNFFFVLPLIIALLFSTNKTVAERIDRIRKSGTRKTRFIVNILMIALGVLILVV